MGSKLKIFNGRMRPQTSGFLGCTPVNSQELSHPQMAFLRGDNPSFWAAVSTSGVPGRAEEHRPVFCCESPEEGRGADGRWRWVHDGGEESPLLGLGAPIPDPCLLHVPDQGKTKISHFLPHAENALLKYRCLVKGFSLLGYALDTKWCWGKGSSD